ncbi:OsmC family protein [Legionella fallonii]|uniref:Putative OsmC family protein n=1 Tax=Legionella fallonii LLAP-10 TaxID=1212491 RepID=A0A098G7H4_9GAMM|nr:OsmC family protein [Legionella fallonii]CEG58407.1 putative OsmC family protein [Legionella fallonii LLAP-10]
MLMYNIHLQWERETEDFNYRTYNRKHTVFFNGGPKIEINSSSNFIRNPQFHSPEELLIASLSSCFLLTFLALCSKKKYIVNSYLDQGFCHINEHERVITDIVLSPIVLFEQGSKPDKTTMRELFDEAHNLCFIANSLKVPIRISPEFADTPIEK